MSLLQQEHEFVFQPPTLFFGTGFEYCPVQTVQPVHNGSYHWLLVSTVSGVVSIHDSLNTQPTEELIKQISQLFSPDGSTPAYTQLKCHKQLGGTDCGIFAIAYAIDILLGNEPQNIRYDQNKMREHLVNCLQSGKMTAFPRYRTIADDRQNNHLTSEDAATSSWITPRRYNLRSSQQNKVQSPSVGDPVKNTIRLSNRFSLLSHSDEKKDSSTKIIEASSNRHQVSQVVHNISNSQLSSLEMAVLEKGLNFCPSTKELDTEKLMDDVFSYCRNIRLKHHFASQNTNTEATPPPEESVVSDEERCEMKSKYRNPYFCVSSNITPPALEKYIASTKSDIRKLAKQPNKVSSNSSSSERMTLDSLKKRKDIIITKADKGGKVVVMDKERYIKNCQTQLDDKEFYETISTDFY